MTVNEGAINRLLLWAPVVLFGKMNSGASPVIYAISGAILILSILVVIGVVQIAGRTRTQ